ncbi:OmpA family protein [Thiofilum flexile]|uniref:OmpA family protein n=1 Tax=Thiofilum flexile TaxID=125627 RepID=UPI0003A01B67|nr:OmpA family protein [Thiofilum flexile]
MSLSKRTWNPMLMFGVTTMLFIVCLTAITLSWKQNSIEVDLTQRTRQALDLLGFLETPVQFSGRDGTLLLSTTEAERIKPYLAQLSQIEGVHQLTTSIQPSQATSVLDFNANMNDLDENGLYIPSQAHPLEQINLASIHFDYAQVTLTSESFGVLNKLAHDIKQYPDIKIEISGHTDNTGTALGNLALSKIRAQAVVDYLVKNGINPQQLVAVGYGSTHPIATNTTRSGRETNQRIALTVLQDKH